MRVRLVFSATAPRIVQPSKISFVGSRAERDEVVEGPDVVEAGLVGGTPGLALRLDRMDLLRKLQADAKWMRHHTQATETTIRACAPKLTAGSVRCRESSPRIAR